MTKLRLAVADLVAIGGCGPVEPVEAGNKGIGAPCTDAAKCASGVCAAGICSVSFR